MRLVDMACSFLDDMKRITQRDYEPSDQDVVRSRLRTIGVQEYKLVMENYGACLPVSASLRPMRARAPDARAPASRDRGLARVDDIRCWGVQDFGACPSFIGCRLSSVGADDAWMRVAARGVVPVL